MINSLPLGTIVPGAKNKYQIDGVLGQGTFGITYLAHYRTRVNGEIGSGYVTAQVCIKEFFMKDFNTRDENSQSLHDMSGVTLVEKYRKSFMREAKNLSKMHHPGIVNVFEVIEANNTIYIVMEYIDGGSLDDYIRSSGRLSESSAIKCFRPICEAMHYMHQQKMLHLDLKPKNVMRDSEGHLYIIDFGLSKQYNSDGEPESSTTIGLGTPGYAPAEQAKQKDGDKTFRSTIDVYALGATLYKMLTGNTPPDATEVSEAIIDGGNLILHSLQNLGISKDIAEIVSTAMWPSSQKRVQTVSELMSMFGWSAPDVDSTRLIIDEETAFVEQTEIIQKDEPKCDISKSRHNSEDIPNKDISPSIHVKNRQDKNIESDISIQSIPLPNPKKKKIITSICIIITLSFLGIGYYIYSVRWPQHQFELAESYYNGEGVEQSYDTAFLLYHKAAEHGLVKAQYRLAQCYNLGNGVEKSYTEELFWLKKAANQGYANAQNSLGISYENGEGVEQSYTEAVKWYRKAADQGYAEAQYNLGSCYYYGKGVEQSFSEAVSWYRKAAEQGNADAQYELGFCYDTGNGVDQSYTDAVTWYRKAAEQGLSRAQNNLGFCYDKGTGVEQSYSEAVSWYRKAAEQGFANAQYNLGAYYYNGYGVEQSYSEAVSWFRKAAEQGYADAQVILGDCYVNGRGIQKSYSEAVSWFRKAAEQENADAQCWLGMCYENAIGVERSSFESFNWYRKAAEQGDAEGQGVLGLYYAEGLGVKQDFQQAVLWLKKSAEQGYVDAQWNLGISYFKGEGISKDKSKAIEWWTKAANQGDKRAIEQLKDLGIR